MGHMNRPVRAQEEDDELIHKIRYVLVSPDQFVDSSWLRSSFADIPGWDKGQVCQNR